MPMTPAPLDHAMAPPSTPAAGKTMTAIVQDEYGPAPEDVLWVERSTRPRSERTRSSCACTRPAWTVGTWHVMAGLPIRFAWRDFGLRRPKYRNCGRSLAGTVEAIGT